MIWIAVAILVMIIIWTLIKERSVLTIAVSVVVALMVYLLGNVIVAEVTLPEYVVKEDAEIASLETDSLTQGSFVLGTGQIDQEPYYFYLKAVEDNGYKLDWSLARNTTIHEYQQTTGRVIEHTPTLLSTLWSIRHPDKVDIFVPEGSITREYLPN